MKCDGKDISNCPAAVEVEEGKKKNEEVKAKGDKKEIKGDKRR